MPCQLMILPQHQGEGERRHSHELIKWDGELAECIPTVLQHQLNGSLIVEKLVWLLVSSAGGFIFMSNLTLCNVLLNER